MTIYDDIYWIDKDITYQYNLPFITTASSGCGSFKVKYNMIWGQLEVGMSRDGAATKIKQNGGEFASIDVIFSIDNVMTYQYNLPFITTASSGCVS